MSRISASEFIDRIVGQFNIFIDLKNNSDETEELLSFRRSSFEKFLKLGIPTQKHEEWKFSNLSFLYQNDYSLFNENQVFIKEDIKQDLLKRLSGSQYANKIVYYNGFYNSELSDISRLSDKIKIIENQLLHQQQDYSNSFYFLNSAFSPDAGIRIEVKENIQILESINLIYIQDSKSSSIISNPKIRLIINSGSSCSIVESSISIGNNHSICNSIIESEIHKDSKLDFCKIQTDSESSRFLGFNYFIQKENSELNSIVVSLSGAFIRNDSEFLHSESHCSTNLYGFYFTDSDNFVDNHTTVIHAVPNCKSFEKYKGILSDKSHAVFNGKIKVLPLAQKTEAYQSNKNILLSNEAVINTKPQLEIFADDVKCSHGATSGYLEKDSMFYLRARGIGEELARALLLNAFAAEIIEKLSVQNLNEEVSNLVMKRLNLNLDKI